MQPGLNVATLYTIILCTSLCMSPLALLKKYGLFSRLDQNFLQPWCNSSGGKSTSNAEAGIEPGDPIPAGGAPMGVCGTGVGPGPAPGVPGVPGATGRLEGEPLFGILRGVRPLVWSQTRDL